MLLEAVLWDFIWLPSDLWCRLPLQVLASVLWLAARGCLYAFLTPFLAVVPTADRLWDHSNHSLLRAKQA